DEIPLRDSDAGPETTGRQPERIARSGPVQHRSGVTRVAYPSRRHAIERHIVEHRPAAPFRFRRARRQLRRRPPAGKLPKGVGGKEARILLLKLLDEFELL